ncbi:TPA: energy transducer TonB [Pseudomonas aeruginosa]
MSEKQNALMAVAVGAVVLGLSAGGFFTALNAKKTADQNAESVEQLKQQLVTLQARAEVADGKITGLLELATNLVDLSRKTPVVDIKNVPSSQVAPQERPAAATIDAHKVDPAPAPAPAPAPISPTTTENAQHTMALAELLSDTPKVTGPAAPMTPDQVDNLLVEHISNNWHRPASAKDGMQVTIEIQMDRKGLIKHVKVQKGSGDEAFDQSAVLAIQDVKSVPEVASLSDQLYQRNYRLRTVVFSPEGLGK